MTTDERTAELERLLENLTPGGSEFHGEPERCAEYAREYMQSKSEGWKKAVLQKRELERKYAAALEELVTYGLCPDSVGLRCPYEADQTNESCRTCWDDELTKAEQQP